MDEQELKESRAKVEQAAALTPEVVRSPVKIRREGIAIYLENRRPDDGIMLREARRILARLLSVIEEVERRSMNDDVTCEEPFEQLY